MGNATKTQGPGEDWGRGAKEREKGPVATKGAVNKSSATNHVRPVNHEGATTIRGLVTKMRNQKTPAVQLGASWTVEQQQRRFLQLQKKKTCKCRADQRKIRNLMDFSNLVQKKTSTEKKYSKTNKLAEAKEREPVLL